jgi:hypothetical protein
MGDMGRSDYERRMKNIQELNDQIKKKGQLILAGQHGVEKAQAEIRRLEHKIEEESKIQLGLQVGQWRISRRTSAQDVAKIFIVFHLLAIGVGIFLILQPSPMKELGVALMVGGLFAFGNLLSAIWTQIFNDEKLLVNLPYTNDDALVGSLKEQVHILEKDLAAQDEVMRELMSLKSEIKREKWNEGIGLAVVTACAGLFALGVHFCEETFIGELLKQFDRDLRGDTSWKFKYWAGNDKG